MLRSLKDLERYEVNATDGDVGGVVDFLLEDERWVVRYLVVQTGGSLFLNRHRVLITPISFRQIDWSSLRFHLALTTDKVKNSPDINTDKPVSRQHERNYYRYYGYPSYWGNAGTWGMGAFPGLLTASNYTDSPAERSSESGDIHLRSATELRKYHVQGSDGAVGHVEDFIVDDETWEIRYLVIDTNKWWFGKKVLVAPHWANRISWTESTIHMELSQEAIKSSPSWNGSEAVNREYEMRLYDYYGRPTYWATSATPSPADSDGAGPRH